MVADYANRRQQRSASAGRFCFTHFAAKPARRLSNRWQRREAVGPDGIDQALPVPPFRHRRQREIHHRHEGCVRAAPLDAAYVRLFP